MMSISHSFERVSAVPSGVGGAVGVSGRRWYVAVVGNNTEKAVEERLGARGYETFVARQSVLRVWKNGRRARVDKVIIPSLVFVRCTEAERREIVALPYVSRFMTDKASGSKPGLSRPLAVIPQVQIDTLRFMLGQSDVPVSIVDAPYRAGDRIVVVRGSLRGLEGEVVRTTEGRSELIVRIDLLGCARVEIDSLDIEPLKNRK